MRSTRNYCGPHFGMMSCVIADPLLVFRGLCVVARLWRHRHGLGSIGLGLEVIKPPSNTLTPNPSPKPYLEP